MPTGREEIWRFTPLKRFKKLLVEGEELPTLSWEADLPEGVNVSEAKPGDLRALAVEPPVDRVSAVAALRSANPTLIEVAANTEFAEPIVFTGKASGGEHRDHYVIKVGANAKATIIIQFEGEAQYAEKTDVVVGDGAWLNLVFVQDLGAGSLHAGQRSVLVGRDATVKVVSATLGEGSVRLQENARYAGPGGEFEQYGVYFVDGEQHVQHRLFVDHNAPKTKSNVDYRGALQGKGAHAVWIGDVLIRKAAEDIDTYESNKNLLLTEGCKADSVPNLEIETGEIAGAGHSSSTGRFDELQLFYLMSRGVEEREARRLIVHGFFWEIIRQIGVADIEQRLLARVEQELELLEDSQA
ncbi:Fe-S cluster assembly protein SufD [Tessaracoccus sp. OH4464_COT-324]|nr:Fe-S cluster assembly protein SufD [Tessaracoccus sp. OH4464_COT-324]